MVLILVRSGSLIIVAVSVVICLAIGGLVFCVIDECFNIGSQMLTELYVPLRFCFQSKWVETGA